MHATETAPIAEALVRFKAPTVIWDLFRLEGPIKGRAWRASQLEWLRNDGMWACNSRCIASSTLNSDVLQAAHNSTINFTHSIAVSI